VVGGGLMLVTAGQAALLCFLWGLMAGFLIAGMPRGGPAAAAWRGKDSNLRRMFALGLILGVLGAIGTFPTFFEAFASE
jgi:hypothetical protein